MKNSVYLNLGLKIVGSLKTKVVLCMHELKTATNWNYLEIVILVWKQTPTFRIFIHSHSAEVLGVHSRWGHTIYENFNVIISSIEPVVSRL